MRRFVLGDLHGGYRALLQVFERSGFDRKTDLLISLGDLVDGWPESKECVQEIIDLPNRVFIIGNHDQWFLDWTQTGNAPPIWTSQGGAATLLSYKGGVPPSHKAFFRYAPFFHVIDNTVFVHGGLDPRITDMRLQNREAVEWDRSLFNAAYRYSLAQPDYKFGKWDRIYVGHSTLTNIDRYEPSLMANVMAMDTGGGWEGKLSLLDIDTDEFWQSDKVADLYPESKGRR